MPPGSEQVPEQVSRPPRVAVVLSGVGARGAFQAGALAALLPALAEDGLVPRVWLGTSGGAVNATLWCAYADEGALPAAERLLEVWRQTSDDDVYLPLPLTLPRIGLQFAGGALLGIGPGTTSLLDTSRLRSTARRLLPVERLADNLARGVVDAVGVVATRMPSEADSARPGTGSGRSVVFLDEHRRSGYDGDPRRALDVVRGPVRREHVLASSAIPAAFLPIEVDLPAEATGWYLDGGVRLNTPLHPAVGLGADRIVVISATSTQYSPLTPLLSAGPVPDVADAAAQVLNAVMADRTTEDLRTLRRTNRWVSHLAGSGARPILRGDGEPYREIPALVVSPPPGAMGALAARVFEERTRGLRRFAELDNWLMGQALRGAGDRVGRRELLSYLFFDEAYFTASIDLGRQVAEESLARGWST